MMVLRRKNSEWDTALIHIGTSNEEKKSPYIVGYIFGFAIQMVVSSSLFDVALVLLWLLMLLLILSLRSHNVCFHFSFFLNFFSSSICIYSVKLFFLFASSSLSKALHMNGRKSNFFRCFCCNISTYPVQCTIQNSPRLCMFISEIGATQCMAFRLHWKYPKTLINASNLFFSG